MSENHSKLHRQAPVLMNLVLRGVVGRARARLLFRRSVDNERYCHNLLCLG